MLRERLLTSVPLIAIALLSFALPGWPGGLLFTVLCGLFLIQACREFFRLTSAFASGGYVTLTWVCGLALTLIPVCTLGSGPSHILVRFLANAVVTAGFVLLCFLAVCREGISPATMRRAFASVVGFLYICWLTSFIPMLYFGGPRTSGKLLVIYLVLVTKIADAGAYTVGTLTARRAGGNHKLLPAISPKKSWEGLIGGTIASLAAALLMQHWCGKDLLVFGRPALTRVDACVVGLGASLVGLVGDMAESALKRAAGVKDSGRLPGLGGVLDLLDSLIATGPLFFAYVYLCALHR